jgi:hypothetical protein
MIAGREELALTMEPFVTMMSMQRTVATRLSDEDLRQMQAETGVDVYAILDLMGQTPTQRLRLAVANVQNLARLHAATKRTEIRK